MEILSRTMAIISVAKRAPAMYQIDVQVRT